MHLVLAVLFLLAPVMGDYTPTSDGAPSDENIAATFAANRVVGDVYPQGADEPFQRLLNTRGGGFVTMNSDPSVVGIDPLTGEAAPVGTDVGFADPVARFIQTGVLNGDFAQGPTDPNAPISDDNFIPYWRWSAAASGVTTARWVADATYASGYRIDFTASASGLASSLYQYARVPRSRGQQFRVLLSGYLSGIDVLIASQFYDQDLAAIGSEVLSFSAPGGGEVKTDLGLVPPTASYVKIRVQTLPSAAGTESIGEVRLAFPPAEASLGLESISTSSAGITTTETVVESVTIPANTFVVGSVYRVTLFGTITSSAANATTFRIRIGTTTLAGTVVVSAAPTATTTASDDGFELVVLLTVRSVGASGSIIGHMRRVGSSTQPWSTSSGVTSATAATTIDTTVANLLELTVQTAAGTTTVTARQAIIECVMAS